jgi:hypothetical protein
VGKATARENDLTEVSSEALRHSHFFMLFLAGAAGFFVKHVETGKCIKDTGVEQSRGKNWGHLTFLEFSDNCLDETAQFRFRANGALLNLKADGCFASFRKYFGDVVIYMFFIYVDFDTKDRSACAQKPEKNIYRAITQTSDGALSVHDKPLGEKTYKTWCAVPETHSKISKRGINPYLGLALSCDNALAKRFNFGKFL